MSGALPNGTSIEKNVDLSGYATKGDVSRSESQAYSWDMALKSELNGRISALESAASDGPETDALWNAIRDLGKNIPCNVPESGAIHGPVVHYTNANPTTLGMPVCYVDRMRIYINGCWGWDNGQGPLARSGSTQPWNFYVIRYHGRNTTPGYYVDDKYNLKLSIRNQGINGCHLNGQIREIFWNSTSG